MGNPKINDRKLLKLIDKEGFNQSAAAKQLGVSRQAVSKRLKELRGNTTKVVAAKKVEQVVDRKIDAMEQLNQINAYANEILDLLMRWNRGEDEALQVLEGQVKTKKVRVGKEKFDVKEFKFKDPRELALKAMAEIRGQLRLQMEIFQALYDLSAVQEFQNVVLETISEVDPGVRTKIIRKLNERRTLRSAVRFS
jgi:predicted transcriptional regulator